MKNTNYFSHDHNSRGDEKILKMRVKYGWEGFGLFWAIVEKLHESTNGSLEKDYTLMAYDLKAEESTVRSVVEDFGLFKISETRFSHKRVEEHNDFRSGLAESGRKGGLSKAKASLKPGSSNKEINKKRNKEKKKEKHLECVLLTKKEHGKLIEKYGQVATDEKILELNDAIMSKGYKYSSHYHTILTWDRKNGPKPDRSNYKKFTG